jgi:redox-sensitive bicupin YhaK (pirin superfamily)
MINTRSIAHRSAGRRHGPITRLVSPGEEGHLIKPFVFLDYVDAPGGSGPNFGFHPHSGIATLTFPLTFDVEHEASTGQIDSVEMGGLEWVLTGGGVWHRGRPVGQGPLKGFQLWFAMPPSHELLEPLTRFIQPEQIPKSGPVTLLLGSHGSMVSPLDTPVDANLLWVELAAGEKLDYTPPEGHQVAWCFAQQGVVEVGGEHLDRELAIFAEGSGKLHFRAQAGCAFLFGTAIKHPHDLVLGSHSVHTSARALSSGVHRIAEIGERLRFDGKM